MAEEVGRIIQYGMGWPNDHFIPPDPLIALLYDPGITMLLEGTLLMLEDRYPNVEVSLELILQGTLGDLVTLVLMKPEASSS